MIDNQCGAFEELASLLQPHIVGSRALPNLSKSIANHTCPKAPLGKLSPNQIISIDNRVRTSKGTVPHNISRVEEILSEQAAPKSGAKRGIVIFDTRYGNTEKIARALEAGLKQAGLQTVCTNQKEVNPESLKDYDLIAVGAPTERITASQSIKEFLEKLKNVDLRNKCGFAFDTRFSFPLSGSAARYIEKELKRSGLEILVPRTSAIVESAKEAQSGVKLKEGEEKKFEQIGRQVATAFAARGKVITV
ncbi:MAG: flavodoxin domain-containing protein [Nitrososphaerota archaeon]|nr:flavodoxin domain-containing protein [Nitrososphaerota archaeon]